MYFIHVFNCLPEITVSVLYGSNKRRGTPGVPLEGNTELNK